MFEATPTNPSSTAVREEERRGWVRAPKARQYPILVNGSGLERLERHDWMVLLVSSGLRLT
jgi:hypothetical protein